ncbi:hypothetical protein GCM10027347_61390 [Larkinella harenae]
MNDENLKPAKPGEVRNPAGRPKGSPNRSTVAKKILAALGKNVIFGASLAKIKEIVGDDIDKMTVEEIMTIVQINDAVSGKRRAGSYKVVMDSAYGAPKQEIDTPGDKTNVIIFKIPDNGR